MNVHGIGNYVKRKQIFRYLHEKEIDVAFLQETHATKSCHRRWQNEWDGKILYSDQNSSSRGVAILFNDRKNKLKIYKVDRDEEGHLLYAQLELNELKYHLINVYAPNDDDVQFFVTLFEKY